MKVAVYTSQIGDYDTILDPFVVDYEYDYFCFSDHDLKSNIGKVVKLNESDFPSGLNNVRKSRGIKTHPHILLSEYDLTIYIDSNILILRSIKEFLKDKSIDSGGLLFKHPGRDCIYDEINELNKGRVDYVAVSSWKKKLEQSHYPRHNGLTENNFMVRCNDSKINSLNELGWDLIYKNSYRDQLSLQYVFGKNNFNPNISDEIIRTCGYFRHVEHKGRGCMKILSIIIPVYNQPKLVIRALDSIPKRDDIEVICIDDCSTDNTYSILEEYKKLSPLDIVLLRNDINSGIAVTTNKGIDIAQGKGITDLDNDDYLLTDNYNKIVDMLPSLDEYDGVWVSNRVERDLNEIGGGEDRLAMGTYMVKKDFVGNTRFPLGRFNDADGIYTNELKSRHPKMYNSMICGYHYNGPRVNSVSGIAEHRKS